VFESLKQALCEAPVLQTPNFNKKFVLVMDATDLAIFAVSHLWVDEVLGQTSY
jgi:hypothetical protein